jgi:hypothetical protein
MSVHDEGLHRNHPLLQRGLPNSPRPQTRNRRVGELRRPIALSRGAERSSCDHRIPSTPAVTVATLREWPSVRVFSGSLQRRFSRIRSCFGHSYFFLVYRVIGSTVTAASRTLRNIRFTVITCDGAAYDWRAFWSSNRPLIGMRVGSSPTRSTRVPPTRRLLPDRPRARTGRGSGRPPRGCGTGHPLAGRHRVRQREGQERGQLVGTLPVGTQQFH